ncbi:MAG: zinc metallopeptidase [Clostridia bacterium]|nr:zinc metallopeptidase [Clostridia bacterium]
MFDFIFDYIDPYTLNQLLYFAAIALMFVGIAASSSVQRTFEKYAKTPSMYGTPAYVAANELLRKSGSSVQVTAVDGALTDHFNPKTNTVGLSKAVYSNSSVAALAVAAHEIGHVMQYEEGYGPIKIRNTILPVAQLGSNIAPILVIVGLILGFTDLAIVGAYLYGAMFLFQVITLPVEFNASRRGIEMLSSNGYITAAEEPTAKKVLKAAAMTYVVAALASLVTFMRLLLISNNRRR